MPDIGRIQSTNFQSLLTELGITRNNVPFSLRSEVIPAVLVGGTVSFVAAPGPPYRVQDVFSEGVQTNPALGDVLADTGPLPVGAYTFDIIETALETHTFFIQWRNAANSASLLSQIASVLLGDVFRWTFRLDVANANERVRLITRTTSSVGIDYQGTILART